MSRSFHRCGRSLRVYGDRGDGLRVAGDRLGHRRLGQHRRRAGPGHDLRAGQCGSAGRAAASAAGGSGTAAGKAEAARPLVQEKYDLSRILRAYDELYASLLGAAAPKPNCARRRCIAMSRKSSTAAAAGSIRCSGAPSAGISSGPAPARSRELNHPGVASAVEDDHLVFNPQHALDRSPDRQALGENAGREHKDAVAP